MPVWSASWLPKQDVHFLHIGKTGGSAVKFALQEHLVTRRYSISLHRHGTKLRDVPEGELVFFFVREPISRFVSGFYSRRRLGQPKTLVPWSEGEREAFEYFDSANRLAEAISARDETRRAKALRAMGSIQHVRSSYWDWFANEEYFRRRSSDIFFLGFQGQLFEDFERLKSMLCLPRRVELPTNPIHAHRNPPDTDKTLTQEAIENLNRWYRADFEFLALCQSMIRERPELRGN